MSKVVESIYQEIADELKISVIEARQLTTTSKQSLVQQYYQWKYNWDPKDESTIPF